MAKTCNRRKPGRPRKDYRDDPDLKVAELAILLKAAGFSERTAFDLALAQIQGERIIPSRVPRGTKSKQNPGPLVGYQLPDKKSFASRTADIRRKLKSGKLRPHIEVRAVAVLLHEIHKRQGKVAQQATILDEG
jgi:hypothetical protein